MSDTDFRRMQEEAARRAREMHSRARVPQNRRHGSAQSTQSAQQGSNEPRQSAGSGIGASLPSASKNSANTQSAGQNTHASGVQDPQNVSHQRTPPPSTPQMPFIPNLSGEGASSQESTPLAESALESLFKDKERTVLLALLILLGAEGGNNELMFALLFLLME